jgi:hypothetical protein
VAGKAPRHDENRVDPQVVAGTHETRCKRLGCSRNSAEAELIEREIRFGGRCAGFDLDEGYHAAAPRDEIDFTDRRSDPAGEDPPAFELQPERRQRFGVPAAFLGTLTLHLIASARS